MTDHNHYASKAETITLLVPDTRMKAERKLAKMMAERGADEQGAEDYLILRQIAVELLAEQPAQQIDPETRTKGGLKYSPNYVAGYNDGLKAAQQEPVAWLVYENWRKHSLFFTKEGAEDFKNASQRNDDLSGNLAHWRIEPLYTTPLAQRTWAGLTDAETEHLWEISRAAIPRYHTFKTLIEKALRERNT